ncbi:MAG: hypothetical protein ABH878_03605 [bacterium]
MLESITITGRPNHRLDDPIRRYWIWPLRFSSGTRGAVIRALDTAVPFCKNGRWIVAALIAGALPFLLSYLFSIPGHQLVSAFMLTYLCLGCLRSNSLFKGLGMIAATYLVHCLLVVLLAFSDPQGTAPLMPGASEYWDKQYSWITTGADPEYEIGNWLPAQAQLLAASVFYGYVSLGIIVFYEGFIEVDLMNYYNAQLMRCSVQELRAVQYGWHIWSILRGLGYVIITLEILSFSLQRLTRVRLSTTRLRLARLLVGLSFLGADCIVKWSTLPEVRTILFQNLNLT